MSNERIEWFNRERAKGNNLVLALTGYINEDFPRTVVAVFTSYEKLMERVKEENKRTEENTTPNTFKFGHWDYDIVELVE
ncbi:MAG: hypothetical protein ACFFD4_08040 [Candidatus Odinarchaeota archaeon]